MWQLLLSSWQNSQDFFPSIPLTTHFHLCSYFRKANAWLEASLWGCKLWSDTSCRQLQVSAQTRSVLQPGATHKVKCHVCLLRWKYYWNGKQVELLQIWRLICVNCTVMLHFHERHFVGKKILDKPGDIQLHYTIFLLSSNSMGLMMLQQD